MRTRVTKTVENKQIYHIFHFSNSVILVITCLCVYFNRCELLVDQHNLNKHEDVEMSSFDVSNFHVVSKTSLEQPHYD